MQQRLISCLCLSLLLLFCFGTDSQSSMSGDEAPQQGKMEEAADRVSEETGSSVSRVVFVDMENACACTRKRCDEAWSMLQAVLDSLAVKPGVERLYIDTQEDLVRPYRKQRPILAAPAIYFFNGDGTLAGMLQGEVRDDQIIEKLY
ncbi:hypothetical protein ACFL4G_05905 [Thermodesulfobacteriota bacterium]